MSSFFMPAPCHLPVQHAACCSPGPQTASRNGRSVPCPICLLGASNGNSHGTCVFVVKTGDGLCLHTLLTRFPKRLPSPTLNPESCRTHATFLCAYTLDWGTDPLHDQVIGKQAACPTQTAARTRTPFAPIDFAVIPFRRSVGRSVNQESQCDTCQIV